MKKVLLLIIFLGILLQSCDPKVRSILVENKLTPIPEEEEIYVIEKGGEAPNNSKYVGYLRIGDTGFTNDCGYNKVIEEAKKRARKSGLNFIVLTQVKKPSFKSSCYRIKATMFRNLDKTVLNKTIEQIKLKNKSRLPEDADYSVVHFYRPVHLSGAAIGYKIRLDDKTVIGRVRNGEYFKYEIRDFGIHKFWAKTESESSVIIDVKEGEEYFIRCGIKRGVAVGRPEMYLMENHIGIKQIEKM